MTDAATVNLSLVSHTNVGKTTLVRTLLGRDVGEVRDAAHVTDVATGYVLLQAGADTLMLWDTPGFGDTARLVTRLRLAGNPIGWFLTQVWDRWKERPLWSSQQAVRNAREEADVILYLVNAAEDPAAAAYIPLEMEVLEWIGKPILILLNQTGAPSDRSQAEEERWRTHLADRPLVRGVLTLDAFARCWVQEGELLNRVVPLLSPEKEAAMPALAGAWAERNLDRFHQSMHALAGQLAEAVLDREEIPDRRVTDRIRGAILNPAGGDNSPQGERAMGRLAERLDLAIRRSTDQLIELHGLSGRAARDVLKRLRDDYRESAPARESVATLLGGILSGAAGGLAADLAAGGLTLGGGLIIGSVLGAVGAKSAARGYNMARGEETNAVRWSEEFLTGLTRSALLRYLAVAHFGRGRGEWEEGEHPLHWREAVEAALEPERGALRSAFGRGHEEAKLVAGELETALSRAARRLLVGLYPEAKPIFAVERRLNERAEVSD
jgi:GTPase SAR1 family protein